MMVAVICSLANLLSCQLHVFVGSMTCHLCDTMSQHIQKIKICFRITEVISVYDGVTVIFSPGKSLSNQSY